MGRHERRARAKEAGIDWRAAQQAKRHADRIESGVLRMDPAKARELLAMWAAIPGRSQEEVEKLNAKAAVSATNGNQPVCDAPKYP